MNIRILQVYPTKNYTIYLYFNDGKVKLCNIKPFLEKGVFKKLQDFDFYLNRCTVINHTLAWDVIGNYDPYNCIDLDPEVLYQESIEVNDPLEDKPS